MLINDLCDNNKLRNLPKLPFLCKHSARKEKYLLVVGPKIQPLSKFPAVGICTCTLNNDKELKHGLYNSFITPTTTNKKTKQKFESKVFGKKFC